MGKKSYGKIVKKSMKGLNKAVNKYYKNYAKSKVKQFVSNPSTPGQVGDTIATLAKRTKDPFPPTKACKMYYNELLTITAPATNLAYEYIYALNGMADTDFTGGGHQPYGYDTMAVIYTNYQVMGTLVELEWFDPSADGVIVGYQIQGLTTSGFASNVLGERPWVDMADISNTGNQNHKFRIFVAHHKALGLTKHQYKDDVNNFGALATVNPATISYLRIFAVSTQSGSASTIKVNVKLTYYCRWWNRNTLAQSTI